MKTTPAADMAELFELKNEPVRSFIDTGWGRFPIELDDAGLNPYALAIYVRISIAADSRQDIPEISALAEHCRMTKLQAETALATLQARNFLTIEGEIWHLTDPTEWLPQ
jgi:hypothetical protein